MGEAHKSILQSILTIQKNIKPFIDIKALKEVIRIEDRKRNNARLAV